MPTAFAIANEIRADESRPENRADLCGPCRKKGQVTGLRWKPVWRGHSMKIMERPGLRTLIDDPDTNLLGRISEHPFAGDGHVDPFSREYGNVPSEGSESSAVCFFIRVIRLIRGFSFWSRPPAAPRSPQPLRFKFLKQQRPTGLAAHGRRGQAQFFLRALCVLCG